jgi:phosphonate transport system permease protein
VNGTHGTHRTAAAANEVYRLPPKLFDARCRACWFVAAALALVVASFWSLDLQWARFASLDALARMGRFGAELLSPNLQPALPRASCCRRRSRRWRCRWWAR